MSRAPTHNEIPPPPSYSQPDSAAAAAIAAAKAVAARLSAASGGKDFVISFSNCFQVILTILAKDPAQAGINLYVRVHLMRI